MKENTCKLLPEKAFFLVIPNMGHSNQAGVILPRLDYLFKPILCYDNIIDLLLHAP
jgi:hypothetical protein